MTPGITSTVAALGPPSSVKSQLFRRSILRPLPSELPAAVGFQKRTAWAGRPMRTRPAGSRLREEAMAWAAMVI